MRSPSLSRVILALAFVAAALLGTGCSYEWLFPNTEMTTVHPETDATRLIQEVYVPITWIMIVIFVVVEALLLYTILRFRKRRGDDSIPEQIHGNTAMEIGWTLIPVVIVVLLAFPTLRNLWALAEPPEGSDPMVIKVTGKQWWWEFEYPEEIGVVTAKELGREERAYLAGATERVLEKGAYSRTELLAEVRRLVREQTAATGPLSTNGQPKPATS